MYEAQGLIYNIQQLHKYPDHLSSSLAKFDVQYKVHVWTGDSSTRLLQLKFTYPLQKMLKTFYSVFQNKFDTF